MRLTWRALPGVVLAAAMLAPVVPASAGDACTYYKWHHAEQRWVRVAYLQDSDRYEEVYDRGVDWDCRYCAVPGIVRLPDVPELAPVEALVQEMTGTLLQEVTNGLEPVLAPLRDVDRQAFETIGNPFVGPDCPPVAPVWDEV